AAADGRAVRRPGRADARPDECRTAAHLDGNPQYRAVRHARHRRGGLPGRHRHGVLAASRPRRRDHRHRPAAAAAAGYPRNPRIRPLCKPYPRPVPADGPDRRRRARLMTGISRQLLHGAAGLASLLLFLALWEALARALHVRPIMLPLPTQIAAELATDWRWYAGHAWYTLLTTVGGFLAAGVGGVLTAVLLVGSRWFESVCYPLIVALNSVPKVAVAALFVIWLGTGAAPKIPISFLIAVVAIEVYTVHGLQAVPQGVLLVGSRWFESVCYPLIVALNSVPKVAVAPLFVIWLGTGAEPKIAIAFLIAVFAIVVDTVHGLKSVPQDVLDLGRVLKGSRRDFFFKVRLPAALPSIVTGMKVAISLALVGAIVGEFVSSQRGLGYVIMSAQGTFDTVRVFAALFVLALMGMALFGLLAWLERKATPWRRRDGGH